MVKEKVRAFCFCRWWRNILLCYLCTRSVVHLNFTLSVLYTWQYYNVINIRSTLL